MDEKQNYKTESASNDNGSQQQIYSTNQQSNGNNKQNGGLIASMFAQSYESAMRNISCANLDTLQQLLIKEGVQVVSKSRGKDLIRICRKTDYESSSYAMKIGNLQTKISILKIDLNSKSFPCKIFAQGEFGQISYLKLQQKQYAIKNVKLKYRNSQSLNAACKQLFFAKIASILQIGPHIQPIFGYDAILYEDCLQFPMQLCQSGQILSQYVGSQLKSSKLMISLKQLHLLQICHCDIKLQNVAWSKKFNKFVFLDFGLSKFIQQPLGYKTLTNFQGTFQYCSEQMKKVYMLRSKSYVDLYYNDLHCLNKTLASLDFMKYKEQRVQDIAFKGAEQIQHEDEKNHKTDKDQDSTTTDTIPFLKLKFNLFNQDYEKVNQIMQKYKQLPNTFRLVLSEAEMRTHSYKSSDDITQIYNNYLKLISLQQNSQNKILLCDAILTEYLLKGSNQSMIPDHETIINISHTPDCQQFIKQGWMQQNWMENIFYFIDDEESFRQRIVRESRLRLLHELYIFLANNEIWEKRRELKRIQSINRQNVHFATMLHDVMLAFFIYFENENKTREAQLILPYFLAFNDNSNSMSMKYQILVLYEPNKSAYVLKNFEFFLANKINVNNYNEGYGLVEEQRYASNIKQTIAKQKQHPDCQFWVETVQIITTINSLYDAATSQDFQSGKNILRSYTSKYYPPTHDITIIITQLLQLITLQKRGSFNVEANRGYNYKKLANRTLSTCFIRLLQLSQLLINNKDQRQIDIIFSDYMHAFTKTQLKMTNQKMSPELVNHYLAIRLLNNTAMNQLQLLLVMNLYEIVGYEQINNYLVGFYTNFIIDMSGEPKQVQILLGAVIRVLCAFSQQSQCTSISLKYFHAFFQWLAIRAIQFCQQASKYLQLHPNIQPHMLSTINRQISILKIIALYELHRFQQAVQIAMQNKNWGQGFPNAAYHYLCCIYNKNSVSHKIMQQIGRYLSELNSLQLLKSNKINRFFTNSILQAQTKANFMHKSLQQSFQIMKAALASYDFNNCFYVSHQCWPLISIFLNLCNQTELIQIHWQLVSKISLAQVYESPWISILMLLIIMTGKLQKRIEKSWMQRSIKICIYGMQRIIYNNISQGKRIVECLTWISFNKNRRKSMQKLLKSEGLQKYKMRKNEIMKRISKRGVVEDVSIKLMEKLDMLVQCLGGSYVDQYINQAMSFVYL